MDVGGSMLSKFTEETKIDRVVGDWEGSFKLMVISMYWLNVFRNGR